MPSSRVLAVLALLTIATFPAAPPAVATPDEPSFVGVIYTLPADPCTALAPETFEFDALGRPIVAFGVGNGCTWPGVRGHWARFEDGAWSVFDITTVGVGPYSATWVATTDDGRAWGYFTEGYGECDVSCVYVMRADLDAGAHGEARERIAFQGSDRSCPTSLDLDAATPSGAAKPGWLGYSACTHFRGRLTLNGSILNNGWPEGATVGTGGGVHGGALAYTPDGQAHIVFSMLDRLRYSNGTPGDGVDITPVGWANGGQYFALELLASADGTLHLVGQGPSPCGSFLLRSRDAGATWTYERCLWGHGPHLALDPATGMAHAISSWGTPFYERETPTGWVSTNIDDIPPLTSDIKTVRLAVGPDGAAYMAHWRSDTRELLVKRLSEPIDLNDPPVLGDLADLVSAEGDEVALAFAATDADGDTLAWSATGLPAGVAIDAATGVLTGALGYEAAGTYTVEVTVSDADHSASGTFEWNVANVNRAPTLDAIADRSSLEDDVVALSPIASDPDGDALAWSATGLPAGVSIDPAAGAVSGAPTTPGTYPVTIVATDGALSASTSFMWTVLPRNVAPDCAGATPSIGRIWPPDHRMVLVDVRGVTDADADTVSVTVTRVLMDEGLDASGDGRTEPDASGIGTSSTYLRAERSGNGDGRIYVVEFTASDGRGGSCAGTVSPYVPKSASQEMAVDSGVRFDASAAAA